MQYLKPSQCKKGQEWLEQGQPGMSTTRLATLLMILALEQWRSGQLTFTNIAKSTEVATVEERIVPRTP